MANKDKIKLYAAIFFSILIWGTSFPAIKIALQHYTPFQITCWRIFFASITYVFFIPLLKLKLPAKKDILIFLAISLIGIIGYHFILNLGEQKSTASMAGFIVNISPLFTIVIAALFLREKISLAFISGASISLIGIWLMNFSLYKEVAFNPGTILLVIAALCWSLFFVFQKILTKKYRPAEIICYSIWISCVIILYFIIKDLPDISKNSDYSLFSLLYLGVFPTAVAYILWSYVISQLPVSKASVFTYLVPLISFFISFFLLDERPDILFFPGSAAILAGVFIVNLKRATTKKK